MDLLMDDPGRNGIYAFWHVFRRARRQMPGLFATLVFLAPNMLKIGSVRWRGKCTKHPGFDPVVDGPGAVRGNCPRCNDLVAIHELHQQTLRLMRNFRTIEETKMASRPMVPDDKQLGLFA